MADFSRRSFLKSASIASAAVAAGSVGLYSPISFASSTNNTFKLKYANNVPMTHPLNIRARAMAKAIKEETNGAVEITIFPSNQLGSDTDTLGQLRSGAVDMFTLSPMILGTLIPSVQISAIGFAFKDYDTVWSAMDGDLGAHVRSEIKKTNTFFAFDSMWDNGYRVTTTNKTVGPVETPEKLVGLKLRVPPSPIIMSMFKALEAAPTSINFAETYSALQTGIVVGQENPLTILNSTKLYEVQKYCSLTNHVWDGFWMLGNSKKFESMPADLQAIVHKHVNLAAIAQREDLAKLSADIRETLKTKGLEIFEAPPAPFRAKLSDAKYYSNWQETFGSEAWAILEKYSGTLA
jgi:tripartite ATP-independent transporter DctP family solute receptor